jgi:large subunit ribosomal protein L10
MARRVKELAVRELTARFATLGERGCVLMGFGGMKARDSANVRRLLSGLDAQMMVVKNALFALALEQLGAGGLKEFMDGPTAVITSGDAVRAAKAAHEAVGSCEGLRILGGYAEGRVLDGELVEKLASLPSRDVLLAQVLGCMRSPAQRFAGCVAAVLCRLASVLEELSKQRQRQERDAEA